MNPSVAWCVAAGFGMLLAGACGDAPPHSQGLEAEIVGDEKRPSGTSSEDAADREREARRDRAERLRRKIAGIVEEAETGREAEKEKETPREFVERRMRELEAEEAEQEEEEEEER